MGKRKPLEPDDPRHGSTNGYVNHGCRCTPCRAAHAKDSRHRRRARQRRIMADPTLAPHGQPSTYNNWGCTCVKCLDARSAYDRKRRADKRAASGDR